ncbi:ABC transporter ATP-binding protein [Kineosporia sp. J2-2]|uniref:ABC transporter ATP-binding protein n=1 Tax=Kineosporia corallincola TaxID=2835133 RepID=A0ABS5TBS0_9ACTN|nr:ABC transporter ATP-binding protein [Kineosporia corallincola]MBT0768528.1 ABC transporter ATP-binding protein [Kineosporia corallincola]
MTSETAVLAVDDLNVSFETDGRRVDAVRGTAFELLRGRVTALVGESGSGKSVSATAVLGLMPGTARVGGSIRLNGEELIGADPGRLRQVRGGEIGTVFQEPMTALNPVFTVGAQIAEAIRTHRTVSRAEAAAQVRELLTSVGLDDPERIAGAYPHELSGGQLQRAMIAMAVSCDPVLLIADEPTTALDVTVQAGILHLLRELCARLDTSILLITHDMGVVADLADDVVVMRDGEVVEKAPVAELFARPRHEYTRSLLSAVPRLPELGPVPAEPVAEHWFSGQQVAGRLGSGQLPEDDDQLVTFRDVVIEYRGRGRRTGVRAVDGVDLGIAAGEVLGLVGESGSGKSTLGRALAGLVPVTSGTLRVDGVDVALASRRSLRGARTLRGIRSRMGIVFQDPASSLNPRHSVATSIAEPLTLHTGLRGPQLRRRIAELLEAVRVPADFADRYPHEMSGGQRQRIAIARALALDPALLIADEPTSALDVSVQAAVLELVRELQTRLRFACLFISHDLAVVEQLADRVAVMNDGRIVEQGPAGQVLSAPRHPYTRRLLAAAPVADPHEQRRRRQAWQALTTGPRPAESAAESASESAAG